jgi:hypothetical protein
MSAYAKLLLVTMGVLLALLGGCSDDDTTPTGPTIELTLGTSSSESVAGGATNTYRFTAATSDTYTADLTNVTPGDAFFDLDVIYSGGITICFSFVATQMSCTMQGMTPNAVNAFTIANVSTVTNTLDLLVEEQVP